MSNHLTAQITTQEHLPACKTGRVLDLPGSNTSNCPPVLLRLGIGPLPTRLHVPLSNRRSQQSILSRCTHRHSDGQRRTYPRDVSRKLRTGSCCHVEVRVEIPRRGGQRFSATPIDRVCTLPRDSRVLAPIDAGITVLHTVWHQPTAQHSGLGKHSLQNLYVLRRCEAEERDSSWRACFKDESRGNVSSDCRILVGGRRSSARIRADQVDVVPTSSEGRACVDEQDREDRHAQQAAKGRVRGDTRPSTKVPHVAAASRN